MDIYVHTDKIVESSLGNNFLDLFVIQNPHELVFKITSVFVKGYRSFTHKAFRIHRLHRGRGEEGVGAEDRQSGTEFRHHQQQGQ